MKRFAKIMAAVLILALAVATIGCTAPAETQPAAAPEAAQKTEAPAVESTAVPEEQAEPENPVKVGVVFTVAGLGGASFNDVVFEGVKRAETELGITYDYVEPKAIADEQIVIEEMASSGEYGLIICIGFEMADALKAAAATYPDQKFAFIDSSVDFANVANYACKEQEGSYLCGALVALAEQEGISTMFNAEKKLGFVGGSDTPILRRFAAGFIAGARYIDPDYELLYDFVGSFNDPATAKVMATTDFNKGCDVVYHAAGASGQGVFQAAEEQKFIAVGVNLNQNATAPDYIIASMLKRVDNAAYHAIQSVVDGTFAGGTVVMSLADAGVGYTNEGSNIRVTPTIQAKLDELQAKIIGGEIVVPDTIEGVDAFIAALS